MKKFSSIAQKYESMGISADNIEYAISAVKSGSKREHIIDNLTADYRGLNSQQATSLLEELFRANGGEFKKENRNGYLYGSIAMIIGLACALYILYVLLFGGVLVRPVLIGIGALGGIGAGIMYFVQAISGNYRDDHDRDINSSGY
jgi:hypothetical protein